MVMKFRHVHGYAIYACVTKGQSPEILLDNEGAQKNRKADNFASGNYAQAQRNPDTKTNITPDLSDGYMT